MAHILVTGGNGYIGKPPRQPASRTVPSGNGRGLDGLRTPSAGRTQRQSEISPGRRRCAYPQARCHQHGRCRVRSGGDPCARERPRCGDRAVGRSSGAPPSRPSGQGSWRQTLSAGQFRRRGRGERARASGGAIAAGARRRRVRGYRTSPRHRLRPVTAHAFRPAAQRADLRSLPPRQVDAGPASPPNRCR